MDKRNEHPETVYTPHRLWVYNDIDDTELTEITPPTDQTILELTNGGISKMGQQKLRTFLRYARAAFRNAKDDAGAMRDRNRSLTDDLRDQGWHLKAAKASEAAWEASARSFSRERDELKEEIKRCRGGSIQLDTAAVRAQSDLALAKLKHGRDKALREEMQLKIDTQVTGQGKEIHRLWGIIRTKNSAIKALVEQPNKQYKGKTAGQWSGLYDDMFERLISKDRELTAAKEISAAYEDERNKVSELNTKIVSKNEALIDQNADLERMRRGQLDRAVEKGNKITQLLVQVDKLKGELVDADKARAASALHWAEGWDRAAALTQKLEALGFERNSL